MSTQFAKVLVPSPVAVPRGAEWVSELVTELPLFGRSLWASLVAVEKARAHRESERLAARHARVH